MRLYRPHSFFTLLLLAFFFVCIPLLAALYSSVQILDGLVQKSVTVVYSSVEMAKRSREVAELVLDQERMARLFDVLGEPVQLAEVNATHELIENDLLYIRSYSNAEELAGLIGELTAAENYINAVLNRFTSGPELLKKEKHDVLDRYRTVGSLARKMQVLSNRLMIDEVQGLRGKVDLDKKRLVVLTSGLILFSVVACVVFVLLLSRPIRQIDRSIEHLGNGDFLTPVVVTGPRDLEDLGRKLDWLRKRLASLDREKIKLIAHISHDLKTPLASIKEGAGLLRDELVGPMNRQQKEVVAILEKNCSKLQKLIEDILNFNMAKARAIPLEKKHVRLDDVVREVVTDHRNSVLARNINLDVQLDSVAMYGNRKQLKTVFDNLLSNAVKFTPEGGAVNIRLREEDQRAVCLVEDSGIGIDMEDRGEIFSPFFQGKGAEKTFIKGSGLGLAISKEYIQNHGGTIRLLPDGRGARFEVVLPLKE
ncbi:MAG: HAMP domain-containing sensor histidine kinase [Desulfobulbaceae bacterium]